MSIKALAVLGVLSGWLMVLLVFIYKNDSPVIQRMAASLYEASAEETQDASSMVTPASLNDGTRDYFIPEQEQLKKMSERDLELLMHRYISSPQTTCLSVERMGKLLDGGWEVCLDPRYAPDPNNCLVYSFGINNDFSFDDDIAAYGCEVHSFDPSMTNTEDHLRGTRVHFHLEGIAEFDRPDPKRDQWKLFTVTSFRKRLGHQVGQRRIDILKMDVEGSERLSLPLAIEDGSLSDVTQISFELHKHRERRFYLSNLSLLRECYKHGLRIYMTNRNIHCPFTSPHTGKLRTQCHEVYMLNVTLARSR